MCIAYKSIFEILITQQNQYNYETEEELPKNLKLAKKIIDYGVDVWLVPNISKAKSADYIIKDNKTQKLNYSEAKIITGNSGLENALNNGATQADTIIVDVQIPMRAKEVAIKVYSAFIKHKTIKEIWLFKGSRRIIIKRQWALSKNFLEDLQKEWIAKK